MTGRRRANRPAAAITDRWKFSPNGHLQQKRPALPMEDRSFDALVN
jgi:hypothetical protein